MGIALIVNVFTNGILPAMLGAGQRSLTVAAPITTASSRSCHPSKGYPLSRGRTSSCPIFHTPFSRKAGMV